MRTKLEIGEVAQHGIAQLLLWSAFYYQFPALLPHMASAGFDIAQLSGAISVAILLWALLMPKAGRLVDQGHGLLMMRLGGVLGICLLGFMTQVPPVFALILVAAMGLPMAATLYDPCFAILLRTPNLDGNKAITKVTLIAGLSTLLSFPLAILASTIWPWQGVMMVFSVLALLGVLFIPKTSTYVVARDVKSAVQSQSRKTAPWADVIAVALPYGLIMFSHAAILFLLPLALLAVQPDNDWAYFLPAILGPAQIAGRLMWRRFAPQDKDQRVIASFMFAFFLLPPILLVVAQVNWILVLAALILQGALFGIHTVSRPLVAATVFPAETLGHTIGMIGMLGLMLMAAGPLVGGLILTAFGYQSLIAALIIINALALGAAVVLQFGLQRRAAWIRL